MRKVRKKLYRLSKNTRKKLSDWRLNCIRLKSQSGTSKVDICTSKITGLFRWPMGVHPVYNRHVIRVTVYNWRLLSLSLPLTSRIADYINLHPEMPKLPMTSITHFVVMYRAERSCQKINIWCALRNYKLLWFYLLRLRVLEHWSYK